MKRFLVCVVIVTLGVFTIGCDSKKDDPGQDSNDDNADQGRQGRG